jgi:hypothetical protein
MLTQKKLIYFYVALSNDIAVFVKRDIVFDFSVLSFGCFPGVWFILADVSEHSICSIFKADDLEVM